MGTGGAPMELVDSFRWEKRSKIITRDVHGVCGLMNFTHFSHLTAEPSTPLHIHSGIMEIPEDKPPEEGGQPSADKDPPQNDPS